MVISSDNSLGKPFSNITIIGTSHISEESMHEIIVAFHDKHIDIVCVELDAGRLHAMLEEKKHPDKSKKSKTRISDIRKYGFQGWMFAVIGHLVQKKLGNIVNIKPGSDMLTAVDLAQKQQKQLELIDQPIQITLQQFSKEFSWKEKFRILRDIFTSPFNKKLRKQASQISLQKVPSKKTIIQLLQLMKERYPTIYKVLIEERNVYMAKKIVKLLEKYPDKTILVVVGAGHEIGFMDIIQKEYYRRDKIY